jgi:radical SAM superfamily enzyme YgiQ (UPF0313 family)
MKVYLIKASAPGDYKEYKKTVGVGPPQNIFSAAACMPEGVEIKMCDETVNMEVDYDYPADIVAVFMSTPDAYRAYEITSSFHDKGVTTLLGGLHTTFMPEEAAENADAIVKGEIEGLWEVIFDDYANGFLQQVYERTEPFDLAQLKPYPTDLVDINDYQHIWSVLVSRGCKYKCAFCTVPRFFDGGARYRPVKDVIEEIRRAPSDWIELHGDNIVANRAYAVELFTELAKLDLTVIAEADIGLAKDDELFDLAVKAGLKYLLIGLETPSKEALKEVGKGFVDTENIKGYIEKFQAHGIELDSSFLFGFDAHDENIFEETLEFVREIGIDESHGVIVIPFPGTKTFEKLEKEGRILTRDWSKYDGSHAVFEPKQMSPETLEEGTWYFETERQKPKETLMEKVWNVVENMRF